MDTAPTEEVKRAAGLLTPGRALDLACGTGRHAIWMHEQGWKVTAVDRDAEAISRIRAAYPAIDARIVDLGLPGFEMRPDEYDLVVAWLYHQRDLYARIRAAVRPGGIAAMRVRLQGRFAAEPGELRRHFSGWTILHEEETTLQTLVCARVRPCDS